MGVPHLGHLAGHGRERERGALNGGLVRLCGVGILEEIWIFGKMGKVCGCGEREMKEKEKWKEIHKGRYLL